MNIEQVYADASRIVVGVTVLEHIDHIYADITLEGRLSVSLTTRQGTSFPFRGGAARYDLSSGRSIQAMWFDPPTSVVNFKVLDLQLKINHLDYINEHAHVTTPIDFSLPVLIYPNQQMLEIHQSVTANGIRITLYGGIVALSETRLYIELSNMSQSGKSVLLDMANLSFNNTSCDSSRSEYDAKRKEQVTTFDCPLLDKHGVWTLHLSALIPDLSNNEEKLNPWVFHFTVS